MFTFSAILSESLRSNRVTACEGETVKLHCPRNTHIHVESTFYGRIVPSAELCPQFDGNDASSGTAFDEDDDLSCDVSNAHMVRTYMFISFFVGATRLSLLKRKQWSILLFTESGRTMQEQA